MTCNTPTHQPTQLNLAPASPDCFPCEHPTRPGTQMPQVDQQPNSTPSQTMRQCLTTLRPPIAAKKLHIHKFGHSIYKSNSKSTPATSSAISPIKFHVEREDQYYWLRDDSRSRPDVSAHLNQENVYCDAVFESTGIKALEETLLKESLEHYKEDDVSVPAPDGDWFYYKRTVKGKGYPLYCRRPRVRQSPMNQSINPKEPAGTASESEETLPSFDFCDQTGQLGDPEEILFDVNAMAEGVENFYFLTYEPTPDHSCFAYSTDPSGNEIYEVKFRLAVPVDGKNELEDVLKDTAGDVAWTPTGRHLFYAVMDSVHRTFQVFVHRLGTSQDKDVCLFEEPNQQFSVGFAKTADKRFLRIVTNSAETSDTYLLDLKEFSEKFESETVPLEAAKNDIKIVTERIDGHRYEVEHFNGMLYILTNKDESIESKLMHVTVGQSSDLANWRDVFPYDPKVNLTSVQCFEKRIVLEGRCDGSTQIWVVDAEALSELPSSRAEPMVSHPLVFQVPMEGSCYVCETTGNFEFETPILRFTYGSLITPLQTIEYNMNTKVKNVVYTVEVPKYDKAGYCEERLMVPSHEEGVDIPMSLVWSRRHFPEGIRNLKSPAPLILMGYGSYGICAEPRFSFYQLPGLDRGMIYAMAHVRGGGEMGRSWYQKEGKFLRKKNTFYDFVACAEFLHTAGISSPQKTGIVGRSAGGLLIGASLNMRPDLFQAVVADVAFLDVLNTMGDVSIPLTTQEWEEWGNPHEREFYYYMLEYSPYDNIRQQRYPPVFMTCSLHDPRVGYWEPAKFVAKLREIKTDDNVVLLKTAMSAGHFASADRYKNIRERATESAFFMWALKVEGEPQ